MVLLGRIELPTSPLPRVRSTTELQQRRGQARPIVAPPPNVKRTCTAPAIPSLCRLSIRPDKANALRMREEPRKNMSREERLAAKLRENLRRRKAQARALADSAPAQKAAPQGLCKPPREG